eukprot:gb/GEZJ01001561.1/.p4 GENE.gb/GEZJ01001561.1/~~gb/GEZJ01001561.1/.p4  ORF type:complete len:118 (+),score=5.68 gb/GEZJ01001561.1/:3431-3784(+)
MEVKKDAARLVRMLQNWVCVWPCGIRASHNQQILKKPKNRTWKVIHGRTERYKLIPCKCEGSKRVSERNGPDLVQKSCSLVHGECGCIKCKKSLTEEEQMFLLFHSQESDHCRTRSL